MCINLKIESTDSSGMAFYESQRTPERLSSAISIPEVVHVFNEMHLVESPKSTFTEESCCSRSRLKTNAKGRYIFLLKSKRMIDDEVYALVLFIKILYIQTGKVGHHTKI